MQGLATIGQLATGVAHDFNNLLVVITASTRLARDALPVGNPAREDLDAVDEAADRAVRLARQLLTLGRAQPAARQAVDLSVAVREIEPLLRRLVGEDVEILTRPAPHVSRVLADRTQVDRVLVNLAVNARDAMPNGGMLTIETRDVGPYVRLTVQDTGVGMDDVTCARLFEPFFSTKAPGAGTGLGLWMVREIVTQSEGVIRIRSAPDRGTTVEIDLPQAAPTRVAERAQDPGRSR
jgi:signal transduction histidine kinase